MDIDIIAVLVWLTGITAAVALLDVIFWAPKRKVAAANHGDAEMGKPNWIIENARALLPVFFAVLLIRAFFMQAFRVPTGSLEPTVLPGDLIAVKQYAYGLRLPITKTKIWQMGSPKRGDIAVFHWPKRPGMLLVKRVIGLPGDHIEYRNKELFINGQQIVRTSKGPTFDIEGGQFVPVEKFTENLNGVQHDILINPNRPARGDFSFNVPAGQYFMMGDNRDNSDDSREWGSVPDKELIGKAFIVLLSWDSNRWRVRWSRAGLPL